MKLASQIMIVAIIVALQLTTAGTVTAQAVKTDAVTAQAVRTDVKLGFCQNLDSIATRIITDIESKKMPHYNKISNLHPELDTKRAEADIKRAEHFAKIAKKYNAPKQAQTIAEYKLTIQDAISKRRVAVDAARQDYVIAVNALQAAHHLVVTQAEQNMQSSVEAIIASTKADCSSRVDSDQAKNTFKAALEVARIQFRAAVKPQPSEQQKLNSLIASRKQAIEVAIAEFRQTAYDAKEKLLLALSQ